jgi:hypothetical protein
MGIMFGKTRSGTGESAVRTYSQMGELHRQLKESCPENVWEEVSARFIYYNREALSGCPDIPWDMPLYLGGSGIAQKVPYNDLNKSCATVIIARKDKDPRFKILKERKNPLWIVHDQVEKKLDDFDDVLEGFREVRRLNMVNLSKEFKETPFSTVEDEFGRLYKYLTVETLFQKTLKELFRIIVTKNDKTREKIRAVELDKHNLYVRKINNRTWQNARNEYRCYHYVQRQDQEISYEKRDRLLACIAVPPVGK